MLQHDSTKELRRRFLLTCVQRNRNQQLRIKALVEIAALQDADAFDDAIDTVGTWSRDDRRAGGLVAVRGPGRAADPPRGQAQAWVWRLADYTRDLHEEYAVQRWPETKRLLGLLVNSSGRAHGRNARRLVHAARNQDRRLAAALLAAGVGHPPRARRCCAGRGCAPPTSPQAVARELLRNFPKAGGRRRRRKRKGSSQDGGSAARNGKAAEATGDGARTSERGARRRRPRGHRQRQRLRARGRRGAGGRRGGRRERLSPPWRGGPHPRPAPISLRRPSRSSGGRARRLP